MLTYFLIQLCKIEKTVVKKSLILEIFPGPRFLMQNSLEKRFIAPKPTWSKNPFACCNCWHVLPFSLPQLILLHVFPWQKDAFKDPSCPFRTSDRTNRFLQPELDVVPGTGKTQMEPFLHSPGVALEVCGSSWSPPHLGTLRESRAQPAKP